MIHVYVDYLWSLRHAHTCMIKSGLFNVLPRLATRLIYTVD